MEKKLNENYALQVKEAIARKKDYDELASMIDTAGHGQKVMMAMRMTELWLDEDDDITVDEALSYINTKHDVGLIMSSEKGYVAIDPVSDNMTFTITYEPCYNELSLQPFEEFMRYCDDEELCEGIITELDAMENEEATKKMIAEKVKEGKYKELNQMYEDGVIDDDDFDDATCDYARIVYYKRGSCSEDYLRKAKQGLWYPFDSDDYGETEVYQEDIDMGLYYEEIYHIETAMGDFHDEGYRASSMYTVYEWYNEGHLTTEQLNYIEFDWTIFEKIDEIVQNIKDENYKAIRKYFDSDDDVDIDCVDAACWWANNNNLSKIDAKDGDDLFDKIMKMEG